MDPDVAWAKEQLDRDVPPRDIVDQLVASGYGSGVAQQIVNEALDDTPPDTGNRDTGPTSRRELVIGGIAILLVIGVIAAGVMFVGPQIGSMDFLSADPVNASDGGPAANMSTHPSFASLAALDGRYYAEYVINGTGNATDINNLTVYNSRDWERERLRVRSGGGLMDISMHTYKENRLTLFCGDTLSAILRTAFDPDYEPEPCTHQSLFALFFPPLLTSARPFSDDLDHVNASYRGEQQVGSRSCHAFRVSFQLQDIYDLMPYSEEPDSSVTNATGTETADICLNPDYGYVVSATIHGQQPANDTMLPLSTTNITTVLSTVRIGGPGGQVTPPTNTVLTVDCPDPEDNETGTLRAVTLTATRDSVEAILQINDMNQSLELTPFQNYVKELSPDELVQGENTFRLYTINGRARDTCSM